MATARFFLMVVLIAAGCALLIASCAPRPATAVWVGGGVHDASLVFLTREAHPKASENLGERRNAG